MGKYARGVGTSREDMPGEGFPLCSFLHLAEADGESYLHYMVYKNEKETVISMKGHEYDGISVAIICVSCSLAASQRCGSSR